MKPRPNHNIRIMSLFFVLSILFFSCSEASDLLMTDLAVEENNISPLISEQSLDSISTPKDTTLSEIKIDSIETFDIEISENNTNSKTILSIHENQFYINGKPTYEGQYWNGKKIEGLLMNSRMVQGIFDDTNPNSNANFAYPDTNIWNAERNTDEFIAAMPLWKSHGLLAFTLNLQGGSPTGYGNNLNWMNSAFDSKGELKPAYLNRLTRILDKADELNMVVILGYFYFGQDQFLENEDAVINAVDNITNWILESGYKNLLIEINNECDIFYDHDILKPNRVHELINRVKQTEKNGHRLLVSTSFKGATVPTENVVTASDYILLHGNGVSQPSNMLQLIKDTRAVNGSDNKPVIINEDDHYNFESPENNFTSAVEEYASWGYFDYRRPGESFEDGFQSIPADWGINSTRKKNFFSKLKEITGY